MSTVRLHTLGDVVHIDHDIPSGLQLRRALVVDVDAVVRGKAGASWYQ